MFSWSDEAVWWYFLMTFALQNLVFLEKCIAPFDVDIDALWKCSNAVRLQGPGGHAVVAKYRGVSSSNLSFFPNFHWICWSWLSWLCWSIRIRIMLTDSNAEKHKSIYIYIYIYTHIFYIYLVLLVSFSSPHRGSLKMESSALCQIRSIVRMQGMDSHVHTEHALHKLFCSTGWAAMSHESRRMLWKSKNFFAFFVQVLALSTKVRTTWYTSNFLIGSLVDVSISSRSLRQIGSSTNTSNIPCLFFVPSLDKTPSNLSIYLFIWFDLLW